MVTAPNFASRGKYRMRTGLSSPSLTLPSLRPASGNHEPGIASPFAARTVKKEKG